MNRHTKINVRYDNDKFSEQTSQNLKFLLRKKPGCLIKALLRQTGAFGEGIGA